MVSLAVAICGGAAAQVTGDFNDDGFDDIAIPASNDSIGDQTSAGVVHILYGSGSGLKAQDSQYWHNNKSGIPGTAESGDGFGDGLAVGDFDNDGFDDLAIGIPGKRVSGEDGAGAVLVLRGKSGGLSTHGSSWWTQDTPGISDGAAEFENFGITLTTGDFNGDGFADLAIAAPGEAGSGPLGAVHILYGSDDGLTAEGDQLFKKGSGQSLAAGDFDRDGFDDLVIGSPNEEVSGEGAAGLVRVLFGSIDGVTIQGMQKWSQDSEGIIGFAEENELFGSALAVGDFNDDDCADLAIGTARETIAPEVNCGRVLVLYGSAVGLRVGGSQNWTQGSDGVKDKQESNDLLGWSLAAGDFNGDGFDDLAIGVIGEKVSRKRSAGAVAVLFGSEEKLTAEDNQLWHQDSGNVADKCETEDFFGIALAAGDFDGDGRSDLAVSVAFEDINGVIDAGALAVLYGRGTGLTDESNQLWHQNKSGINDECEENDRFGGLS